MPKGRAIGACAVPSPCRSLVRRCIALDACLESRGHPTCQHAVLIIASITLVAIALVAISIRPPAWASRLNIPGRTHTVVLRCSTEALTVHARPHASPRQCAHRSKLTSVVGVERHQSSICRRVRRCVVHHWCGHEGRDCRRTLRRSKALPSRNMTRAICERLDSRPCSWHHQRRALRDIDARRRQTQMRTRQDNGEDERVARRLETARLASGRDTISLLLVRIMQAHQPMQWFEHPRRLLRRQHRHVLLHVHAASTQRSGDLGGTSGSSIGQHRSSTEEISMVSFCRPEDVWQRRIRTWRRVLDSALATCSEYIGAQVNGEEQQCIGRAQLVCTWQREPSQPHLVLIVAHHICIMQADRERLAWHCRMHRLDFTTLCCTAQVPPNSIWSNVGEVVETPANGDVYLHHTRATRTQSRRESALIAAEDDHCRVSRLVRVKRCCHRRHRRRRRRADQPRHDHSQRARHPGACCTLQLRVTQIRCRHRARTARGQQRIRWGQQRHWAQSIDHWHWGHSRHPMSISIVPVRESETRQSSLSRPLSCNRVARWRRLHWYWVDLRQALRRRNRRYRRSNQRFSGWHEQRR